MSLTDEETMELHELLDGLVENNLSPSRKAKLEKWIEESEEVRKTYIHFMDMSASLVHYADERLSDETEEPLPISPVDKNNEIRTPCLVDRRLVDRRVYLPRAWVDREKVENELAAITEPSSQDGQGAVIVDTVAVLTKTVGVEWADDALIRPASGNTLEPCTLKLKSGLAQVEFLQGSIVVLEGPVEFEIINPNGGALARQTEGKRASSLFRLRHRGSKRKDNRSWHRVRAARARRRFDGSFCLSRKGFV